MADFRYPSSRRRRLTVNQNEILAYLLQKDSEPLVVDEIVGGVSGDASVTGVGIGAHNILSIEHPDTAAAVVFEGDTMVVNASLKWFRNPAGTAKQIFQMDPTGQLPIWVSNLDMNSNDISALNDLGINSGGVITIGGDTNLYRDAANALKTDDAFEAALSILGLNFLAQPSAAGNAAYRSLVSGSSTDDFLILGDGTIDWGPGSSTVDLRFERTAARTARFRDLVAGDVKITVEKTGISAYDIEAVTTGINLNGTAPVIHKADGTEMFRELTGGITFASGKDITMNNNGQIIWGSDVILERNAANELGTPDAFTSANTIQGLNFIANPALVGNAAYRSIVAAESNDRLTILGDGTLQWGTGSASAEIELKRDGTRTITIEDVSAGSVTFNIDAQAKIYQTIVSSIDVVHNVAGTVPQIFKNLAVEAFRINTDATTLFALEQELTKNILINEMTAPGTPAANKKVIYMDSADEILKSKDSTGTVRNLDDTVTGTENEFPIGGSAFGSLNTSTHYFGFYGDHATGHADANVSWPCPVAGTVTDFYIIIDAMSGTSTWRIEIVKNGVTVGGSIDYDETEVDTVQSDTVTNLSVSKGDVLSVAVRRLSGSGTATSLRWGAVIKQDAALTGAAPTIEDEGVEPKHIHPYTFIHVGGWVPVGQITAPRDGEHWGMLGCPFVFDGDALGGGSQADFGRYHSRFTDNVTSDEAGIQTFPGTAIGTINTTNDPVEVIMGFSLQQLTSVRMFVGLAFSTASIATMVSSNDPAPDYVGIQFSTPRSDTNFQFVSDDGTTQNLHATTQVASTTPFYVKFEIVSGSITVRLLNHQLSEIDSHEFTTNLAEGGLNLMWAVETEENVAKEIKAYGASIQEFNDRPV